MSNLIQTIEAVFIEDNPVQGPGGSDLRVQYYALPGPVFAALVDLTTNVDNVRCWNCGDPTGFVLTEAWHGGDGVTWRPTGLAREGDGPVAVLCEQCAPYVPTEPITRPSAAPCTA
jgi:hypothetical protein